MKHGSLFSGIGGFDLAAEWMQWENVFHCEWNDFGQKVLHHYWPKAIQYNDITKTDFTIHRGKIDILTGGFPCQPYSSAGKRKGKEDERHLWPQMLRAIRQIQPRWVVGENVLGLVNWSGGLVFHEVQADLEAAGYEVWPYVLPAVSVNAPHRRDRVWFVAKNTKCDGFVFREFNKEGAEIRQLGNTCTGSSIGVYLSERPTPHPNGNGLNERNGNDEINSSQGGLDAINDIKQSIMHTNGTSKQGEHIGQTREGQFNGPDSRNGFDNFQNFPTQPPICSRNDGLSSRLDGITFSKWRNESIKAGGNAIVPQVVHQIFKAIEQYETQAIPR
jgi:DNA (cytosine-5)-methyltransferase 1